MSRNPHDRAEQHFGDLLADLVELGDDIGPLPAGMTLQEALAYLWGRVEFYETGGLHRASATANAYILPRHFLADALLRKVIAASFTGDSILLKSSSATFVADAIRRAVIADDFSADAVLALLQGFYADAVLKAIQADDFTADAYLSALVSAIYSMPLTTVVAGEPELVWDDDDSLIATFVGTPTDGVVLPLTTTSSGVPELVWDADNSLIPTLSGDTTGVTQATMPLTTVVGGVPQLVWDGDDSLISTLIPL